MYRVIQIDDDHFVFLIFFFSWKGSSTLLLLLIYLFIYNLFIYKFIFNFLFNIF